MGSDYEQPLWRVVLICGSTLLFLAWCWLRPETEIDRYIEAVMDGKLEEYESQKTPSEQEKR